MRPSSTVFFVTTPTNPAVPNEMNALCKAVVPTPTAPVATGIYYSSWSNGNGGIWYMGPMVFTRYNHVMPPNTQSCDYTTTGGGQGIHGAHTASSRHSGGVNVLSCDGSVKFIKSTVAQATWWAFGTTSGNEVISSDAL